MWDLLLSYSPVDFIPIEPEVYRRLFERINTVLWPLPLGAFLLGLIIAISARMSRSSSSLALSVARVGVSRLAAFGC